MYALVAHMRQQTRAEGPAALRHQIAIEMRAFGCFNGFNTANAFGLHSSNDIDLIINTDATGVPMVDERGATQMYSPRASAAVRAPIEGSGWSDGPWRTLGIGWIHDTFGGANTQNHQMPRTIGRAQNHGGCGLIGNLLRAEGFQDFYYDAYDGGNRRTKRDLTPNELILSQCFKKFEHTDFNPQTWLTAHPCYNHSRMMYALMAQKVTAGSAYQFVGSERPSGQAISYLQLFRNAAGRQISGWSTPLDQAAYALIIGLRNVLQTTESALPLIDYLTNYGSDNTIMGICRESVLLYLTKIGFWGGKNLYRNQNPMTAEGRYNKGGQAEAMDAAMARFISTSRFQQPTGSGNIFARLKASTNASGQIVGYLTQARLDSQTHEAMLREVTARLAAYYQNNPRTLITELLGHARAFPDFREPVAPPVAPRAATPPQGFVQWTSTATNADTIH